MCIIVDANVSHLVFSSKTDAGARIIDWITSGAGRLVFGGLNAEELFHSAEARRWILGAWRAGRAIRVSPERIETDILIVRKIQLKSDDPHVLALARVSGARLLFTNDQPLMNDFKNRAIVNPRGKIFQTPAHRRLLTRKVCRDCC